MFGVEIEGDCCLQCSFLCALSLIGLTFKNFTLAIIFWESGVVVFKVDAVICDGVMKEEKSDGPL